MSVTFSAQNQDVVPISSYDTAGSFLILGCNNGSIYYIGESYRPLVAGCCTARKPLPPTMFPKMV